MKTNNANTWRAVAIAAALVCATVAGWAADTARGGGTKQLELAGLKTTADLDGLQPGDAVVMSCHKCKDVAMTYVTQDSKLKTKTVAGEKHLCPGCGTTMETVGHGKDKKTVFAHVCSKCGSHDVSCCVLKKDSAK